MQRRKYLFITLLFLFISVVATAQKTDPTEFANNLFYRYFKTRLTDRPLIEMINEIQQKTHTVVDTSPIHSINTTLLFKGYSTTFNPFDVSSDTIACNINEVKITSKKDTSLYLKRLLFNVILYGDQSKVCYNLFLKIYKKLKKEFTLNLRYLKNIANKKNKFYQSSFAFPIVTQSFDSIQFHDGKDFPFMNISLTFRKDPTSRTSYLSISFLTKKELLPD